MGQQGQKKYGQCDCDPSKPEKTTQFICNKKDGICTLKLTANKNEKNIFCASEN